MNRFLYSALLCLLFVFATGNTGCGLFKTDCLSSSKSRIEFIVTESEEEEIILINRHDFYYDNDQCSGDIALEIMSNYSVVQNAKRGNDYTVDLTTLSQLVTFNSDYYLKVHQCTSYIKTGYSYFLTSSLFDSACKDMDPYRDLTSVTNAKITINKKTYLSFPDMYDNPALFYYKANYKNSLGCIQEETNGVNVFLIIVIIILIGVICGLVYYQRNYRYVPITERKRIDMPKEIA